MSEPVKCIRKVKVLQGKPKIEAEKLGLSPEDLVLVTTTINFDSPPDYAVEKIEGSPMDFLLSNKRDTETEQ